MAKFRCKSCGGIYIDPQLDGVHYYHVCPPEIIEHATFDAQGKQLTPEKRTPRPNVRNENVLPGLTYIAENNSTLVPKLRKPHPEERGRFIYVDAPTIIISEGAGREEVVA